MALSLEREPLARRSAHDEIGITLSAFGTAQQLPARQRQPKRAESVAAIRDTMNTQVNASTKGWSLRLISETPKYDGLL
jgi:hypothetical protein